MDPANAPAPRTRLDRVIPGVLPRADAGSRPPIAAAVAALFVALVFLALLYKGGAMIAFAGLAGLIALGILLNDARLAAVVAVGMFILIEDSSTAGVGAVPFLYDTAATKVSPFVAVVLVALAATVLAVRRPGVGLRSPRPFTVPLVLIVFALAFGIANGVLGYQAKKFTILGAVEDVVPLLVLPVIIVNVARTRAHLRVAIAIGGALALIKSTVGILGLLAGISTPVEGIGQVTFLEPTANELEMVFLLGVLAARLQGVALPRWARWGWPLALASLTLGYRRFYWLAAAVGFVLVLLIATGRVGRRMIVPGALLVGVCGYIILATGIGNSLDGEIVKRASTINVSHATHNTQDRYRIAERHNVIAAIEHQPLTGLGIGVDWPERYPLPFEVPGLHDFSHIAFLYWWMTCGPLGALAYVLIMLSTVVVGLRVWSAHDDPLIRVTGLAISIGMVGLALTEVASTTVGPDQRGTALVGVFIGLLAAAYRQIGVRDPAETAFGPGTIEQR
jgi:O-antigen ligase/polysaccharide polymerase Wzy-like membrane protein